MVPQIRYQKLGMLNDYWKFDYRIFYHSYFRKHSNKLSFSKSACDAANITVLVATAAQVHNYVTSHTKVLTWAVVFITALLHTLPTAIIIWSQMWSCDAACSYQWLPTAALCNTVVICAPWMQQTVTSKFNTSPSPVTSHLHLTRMLLTMPASSWVRCKCVKQ